MLKQPKSGLSQTTSRRWLQKCKSHFLWMRKQNVVFIQISTPRTLGVKTTTKIILKKQNSIVFYGNVACVSFAYVVAGGALRSLVVVWKPESVCWKQMWSLLFRLLNHSQVTRWKRNLRLVGANWEILPRGRSRNRWMECLGDSAPYRWKKYIVDM